MALKTRTLNTIDLPRSSAGTQRTLTVIRYGTPGAQPKAYLQAGLHADEIPGMLVINHLMRLLNEADDDGEIIGEIVLVPVANPVGLSQVVHDRLLGRYDLKRGENFNRGYPGLVDAVLQRAEPHLRDNARFNINIIRSAIRAVLAERDPVTELDFLRTTLMQLAGDADVVLDLHCAAQAVLHMYMGTPLWPIAEDLHKQLGSQATLLATRSGGNPFDESISTIYWDVAERLTDYPLPPACVAATIELRGESDVDDDLASADAQNLYRFLQRRGYIAGNPGPLPEAKANPTPLEGVDMVRAPGSGIVTFLREPGAFVRKQEKIAIIVDPLSTHGPSARVDVVANTTGILFARRADRMATPGQVLCKIAGVNPMAARDPEHLLDD